MKGQVHSHSETQTTRLVNKEGTSSLDTSTASTLGISIYSIDSYKGVPSISVPGLSSVSNDPAIHHTADRKRTNNVGATNNQNIGKDALSRYLERSIP